jgi:glycosyltransferase involved in cell wall biosynthesis
VLHALFGLLLGELSLRKEPLAMPTDHLLAIPIFNEETYLDRVLESARCFSDNILVVDDGSTDNTPHLLRRHAGIEIITHADNRGYGKSLSDAFSFAIRRGFRWLVTMDCDEQHEASFIPNFVRAAEKDDADIVSGTRYPDGFDADLAPEDRRAINAKISAMLNDRLGLSLTDAFCGFKAYRVATLSCIDITVPGYAMPMQFWVQAVRAGLRVEELPVRLIYNDPDRHFGGFLDDPEARLQHYIDVFEAEMSQSLCSTRTITTTPTPTPTLTTCITQPGPTAPVPCASKTPPRCSTFPN